LLHRVYEELHYEELVHGFFFTLYRRLAIYRVVCNPFTIVDRTVPLLLMLVFWVVTLCGGSMFLWNVGIYLQVHTALRAWRPTSSSSPLWESQISYVPPIIHSVAVSFIVSRIPWQTQKVLKVRHYVLYVMNFKSKINIAFRS
jgi:hypothetical protein